MKSKIISILILLCTLPFFLAQASRLPPEEVKPVIHDGVKYIAPHWGFYKDREQNGGYIEAWDAEKDELLWELKIYGIKYSKELESDVQDIFIVSLEIKDKKLTIVNEVGDKFIVDLDTHEISPKNKVYDIKEKY